MDGVGFATARVNFGFSFNGAAHRVLVPDAPDLNFGANQDFSIEAWIKPEQASTTFNVMSIVDKRYEHNLASESVGYEMNLESGRLHCRLLRTGFGPVGPDLRDGRFHHVAVAVDRDSPTGLKLYVDGQLQGTYNPTALIGDLSNTQPLRIGNHCDSYFNSFFKGIIDELSIYRKALSESEIQGIYNAGSAGKCP